MAVFLALKEMLTPCTELPGAFALHWSSPGLSPCERIENERDGNHFDLNINHLTMIHPYFFCLPTLFSLSLIKWIVERSGVL